MWRISLVHIFISYLYSVRGMFRDCKPVVVFQGKSIKSTPLCMDKTVQSQLTCAVGCMTNSLCEVYVFSPSRHECSLYKDIDHYKNNMARMDDRDVIVDMYQGGRSSNSDNGKTSTMKNSASKKCHIESQTRKRNISPGTHGSSCKFTRACKFSGANCHHGFCHCEVGYYFHPKRNICVRKCDVYDRGLIVYDHHYIKGHDNVSVSEVSQTECVQLCECETRFFCLSADWNKNKRVCHLSELGYSDVPMRSRQMYDMKYVLVQRSRCKLFKCKWHSVRSWSGKNQCNGSDIDLTCKPYKTRRVKYIEL